MITQRQADAIYRQNLNAFAVRALKEIEPSTDYIHGWHQDCICEHLTALWRGEIKRLIINQPPRTLKTHNASVCLPAWGFGQDPTVKFMLVSFKYELAKKMTRKTRLIMQSDWYQRLNPHVQISDDQNEKHYFETTRRGHYYTSSMSSVTGEGADILLIDDPLNPDEAASDVQRNNCIETIRGTLFSRFNNEETARAGLIMQRLNDNDPTGDLLKDEGWYHLKLPAEAMDKSYHYSIHGKSWDLKQGELLFPERLSRQVLDQKMMDLGMYAYAGQYLQEPKPLGGGEIKADDLNYFSTRDFNAKPCNIYITVDPAKGDEDAIARDHDFTAMVVWALAPDNNYYVIDGVRDRLNPTQRIDKLFDLHRKWNAVTGKAPRVGYENIGLHGDLHYIERKQTEESYRFPLQELPPKGVKKLKKIPQIRQLIPLIEQGRIWLPNDIFYKDHKGLPRNFMNDIVEQEFLLFPFAPHDDFIDAMSLLLYMNPIFPRATNHSPINSYGSYGDVSVLDI